MSGFPPPSSHSSLSGAPPLSLSSPPPPFSAFSSASEAETSEKTATSTIDDLLSSSLVPTAAEPPGHTLNCGADVLDGHLTLLEKTLSTASPSDLSDLRNSAVPLAAALLDMGERQKDGRKLMRAHQVLCETAQMGIWTVDSLDVALKEPTKQQEGGKDTDP